MVIESAVFEDACNIGLLFADCHPEGRNQTSLPPRHSDMQSFGIWEAVPLLKTQRSCEEGNLTISKRHIGWILHVAI